MFVDSNKKNEVEKIIDDINIIYEQIIMESKINFLPSKTSEFQEKGFYFDLEEILKNFFEYSVTFYNNNGYSIVIIDDGIYDLSGKVTSKEIIEKFKKSTKINKSIPECIIKEIVNRLVVKKEHSYAKKKDIF